MQIGPYRLSNNLVLAPMAGVTDRPFRALCRELGAGLATSEMVSANPRLGHTDKTRRRLDHRGEAAPVSVQILGADPRLLAEMARAAADHGAQLIDINLGCPAKKVCRVAAGSALLRDEPLVGRILAAVVAAVAVPVTLKMRTGWDPAQRNGPRIAAIAEDSGILALAVHGRTRACGYTGAAEYATIRAIKQTVGIPVIANGDIDSPAKARMVLDFTGADGLMIGRAAMGRPWIFREISHYLETGRRLPPVSRTWVRDIVLGHMRALYDFYGEYLGVRIARKHLLRYFAGCAEPGKKGVALNVRIDNSETPQQQLEEIERYFDRLSATEELAA